MSIDSLDLEHDGIADDNDNNNSKDDISLYDSFELEPLDASEPSHLNKKREARPLFDLIFGILDTFHAATKQNVRRAKEKNIQRIF